MLHNLIFKEIRYKKLYLIFFFNFIITACSNQVSLVVIGHRGAKGHLTENTLPSIAKAIDLGVDGVEIDVFRCASGELVVFHDKRLEKLTNTKGYIEELDLDSIKRIEVLNGYSIPTLKEVLDLIKGRVFLNIELKGSQTAFRTHKLLEKYFELDEWSKEKILISSFNWEELKIFRDINAYIPIAILTEDDPLDAIPIGLELDAEAINPQFKSLNVENVKKIKKAGFKIYPWTINKTQDIKFIRSLNVDGIITDYPDRVSRTDY